MNKYEPFQKMFYMNFLYHTIHRMWKTEELRQSYYTNNTIQQTKQNENNKRFGKILC